jgi:intraflagellar transport protein 74
MRGMRTAQGPSRQVQDGSYYLGILRQKVTELTKEITKLTEERKRFDRESNEYGFLQKRHEELLREVRNLEGKLADYNLAMDKARVSTDPAERDL